jgi:uncharacterized protein YjiK
VSARCAAAALGAAVALCALPAEGMPPVPVQPSQAPPALSAYLAHQPRQFAMPAGLTEISGLAVASPDSVYAHDDNYGIVYELDLASGRVTRAFALDKPTVKADFEDIAERAGHIYLLVSDGRLFEAPLGQHRHRVRYNVYDTGVGSHCETEGLAPGPGDDEFLILCKKPYEDALKDRLVIYKWSLAERKAVGDPWLDVSLDGVIPPLEQATFHPSGFYWRHETASFLIICARNHTAIEVDEQGRLVNRTKLDKQQHPQPEGITLMPDGRLVIADEGHGGRGRLSVYSPPR